MIWDGKLGSGELLKGFAARARKHAPAARGILAVLSKVLKFRHSEISHTTVIIYIICNIIYLLNSFYTTGGVIKPKCMLD